jgi:hypothetical protein
VIYWPLQRDDRERFEDPRRYVRLRMLGHPNVGKNGYLQEHTYVMTQILGRPLREGETVHHKNGIKHDNRPASRNQAG